MNNGDILLFPGWFNPPINTVLRDISSHSTYKAPSSPSAPATKLAAPLPTAPQSSLIAPDSSMIIDSTPSLTTTSANTPINVSDLTNTSITNTSVSPTFSDTLIAGTKVKRTGQTFVQSLLKAA